jgi:general secretion pathway protein K
MREPGRTVVSMASPVRRSCGLPRHWQDAPPPRATGVALIAALIVVFLATAAAVAMSERDLFDLRRSENLLRLSQGTLALQGVEAWAIGQLRREAEQQEPGQRPVARNWTLPQTEIAGGSVRGRIIDAGYCFNVNNIVDAAAKSEGDMQRLQRLLRVLAIDPNLANAILDWIDADLNTTIPGGAEDDFYTRQTPPYRSANRSVSSIGELRKVNGMTPDILQRLAPHLCALPARTMINVNAADAQVIMSLADGIGRATADSIVASRATRPFVDTAQFVQRLGGPQFAAAGEAITVNSDFLEVIGEVKMGDLALRSRSLIQRNGPQGATIVSRRLGEEDSDEDGMTAGTKQ